MLAVGCTPATTAVTDATVVGDPVAAALPG
jgi:hypothetical protein